MLWRWSAFDGLLKVQKTPRSTATAASMVPARWGNAKDIEPFMDPKFEENIILTKTERLMLSSRPPDPKNARNKNVLIVGGSGSGKTRYFILPNLLQLHSSYVLT